MKLIDEINDAVNYLQGSRKDKEDYIDAVCNFFENYYGGKNKARTDILIQPIQYIKNDQNNFALEILEGLKSYPNDKYTLACRLENLLQHLKLRYDLSLSDSLLANFKHKDKNERLLKILKYLHTGEKTRQDIAENFGISDRALATDLKTLQNGLEFMGSHMKIRELERKKNTYISMIHPIFLALNTEEIYSMTVGLKLLSHGTVFQEPMNRIADKIYKQLSVHATGIVDNHTDGENVVFEDSDLHFMSTYALMKQSKTPFTYYIKEPIPCKVTYRENGKKVEISGTLQLPKSGYDRIIVQSESGKTEIRIDDVVEINKLP